MARRRVEDKNIPHDILVEVLARIPSKFLMRLMCVCKLWYSTIHDPHFIELHHTYFPNYIAALSYDEREIKVSFMDHDDEGRRINHPGAFTIENPGSFQVSATQPLNGLVCFYATNMFDDPFVVNLTTRGFVTLPRTSFPYIYSSCKCFLGFDPATKEYKVLKIIMRPPNCLRGSSCEIYTLDTASWSPPACLLGSSCEINYSIGAGSWRILEDPPRPSINLHTADSPVSSCVNGAIYWMVYQEDRGYSSLVVFDVGNEVFRVTRLSEPVYTKNLLALGRGKLAFLPIPITRKIRITGNSRKKLSLWILEENHKNDQVVLMKQKIDFSSRLVELRQLPFGGFSSIGELFLVDVSKSRNIYLNLKTKTMRIKHFEYPSTKKDHDDGLPREMVFHNYIENIGRFGVI